MTEEQKQQTRERVGKRIATLRKLAGLTQEQLAEKAGLQRTHVGRIEAGKYAVTLEVVQAIAEALGMSVDIVAEEPETPSGGGSNGGGGGNNPPGELEE